MKKFYFIFVALSLMFAACETPNNGNEPNDDKRPTAPELVLMSDTVIEFDAEGGDGEIVYTLENAVEDVKLEATCDAAWITDISVGETVTFVVAANEGEARETTITLAYDALTSGVVVKQRAKGEVPVVEGWALLGSMTNDWDVSSAVAMQSIDDYYVVYGFELDTTDSFIFICDGDMMQSRSGNGIPADVDHGYEAKKGGSDIRVKEAGVYDIYLSADLLVYYIMAEGNDPKNAVAPDIPVPNTWSLLGNFEGNNFAEDVPMMKRRDMFIAEDVVFAAEGDTGFKVRKGLSNRDEHNYGARTKKVRTVGEEIQLYSVADKGDNSVLVDVERGVKYDIYFKPSSAQAWVMPAGQEPEIEIAWTKVEGVMFDATNFGVFMYSDTHNLYFDFNSAIASEDGTIPEGIYYVADTQNTGNNFNDLGDYTLFKIYGVNTYPIDGTLEIKHISGGYDIIIDMITAHQEEVKARYTGVVEGNQYMGRPITNPK